jgi:hypothetical protein
MHPQKKRYGVPAAKIEWPSPVQIIAVQIPWDQFELPGGPEAYHGLLAKEGAVFVIVSKGPDEKWRSASKIEKEWGAICEAAPVESHPWNMMTVESDHYPWELFGRLKVK